MLSIHPNQLIPDWREQAAEMKREAVCRKQREASLFYPQLERIRTKPYPVMSELTAKRDIDIFDAHFNPELNL